MELILTEWLGAGNEKVKLLDSSIIQLTKQQLEGVFSNKGKRNRIISEIDNVNKYHKEKFKNQSINPIIELIEVGDELYVRTYQYAAEFEIQLGGNTKEGRALKIKIEPRNLVNEGNFKKMFEVVFNFHRLDDVPGGTSSSFLLLYYLSFIGRLTEVLKRGMYREYVELEDNLTYLREKLLIPEHIINNLNRKNKSKLYCAFSELTPNNIINQAILYTLIHLKKYFRENNSFQNSIRRIISLFPQDEVSNTPININQLKNIRYNRQSKHYEEIIKYCENILQNIGGTFSSDSKLKYSAYYVDMNELFETFVGRKLTETKFKITTEEDPITESFTNIWKIIEPNLNGNLTNYIVEFQNTRHYTLDERGVFSIKPDFLIKDIEGKVVAVVDTKYKRLNNNERDNYGISSSDVYQVLSYAYKFNCEKIFLVYPKPNDSEFPKIEPFTLKADGPGNVEKKLHICFIDLLSKEESHNNS